MLTESARRPVARFPGGKTAPVLSSNARDERARFLQAAARAKQPAGQTFVRPLAHTGARISEILALRARNLDAGTVRIRTRKRRTEHWRDVPVPPELLRALELVHSLRSQGRRCATKSLRPLFRATGASPQSWPTPGIAGPPACSKSLRHAHGISGVPLPTIAAALGHASITTTAVYTTAADLEAREFLARMWAQEPNSAGSDV